MFYLFENITYGTAGYFKKVLLGHPDYPYDYRASDYPKL
jgi:hypothetical protein